MVRRHGANQIRLIGRQVHRRAVGVFALGALRGDDDDGEVGGPGGGDGLGIGRPGWCVPNEPGDGLAGVMEEFLAQAGGLVLLERDVRDERRRGSRQPVIEDRLVVEKHPEAIVAREARNFVSKSKWPVRFLPLLQLNTGTMKFTSYDAQAIECLVSNECLPGFDVSDTERAGFFRILSVFSRLQSES
jgi:hypothetical protein